MKGRSWFQCGAFTRNEKWTHDKIIYFLHTFQVIYPENVPTMRTIQWF